MDHTHFGCYAVITNGAAIALIHKARGPYAGLYDLPGGTPEFGEPPRDAVVREVEEELGLSAQDPRLLHEDSALYEYHRHGKRCRLHHIGLIYRCSIDSYDLDAKGDGLDSNGGFWERVDGSGPDAYSPFAVHAMAYLRSV